MYKSYIAIVFALLFAATESTGIYSNEGVYSGDDRFRDLKSKGWQKVCVMRPVLMPVCADDGKTYSNIDILDCMDKYLKTLGQSVKKESNGFCINDLPAHLRPETTAATS